MKYTKEQVEQLKNKGMLRFSKYNRPLPKVIIKNGFFIIESKMN